MGIASIVVIILGGLLIVAGLVIIISGIIIGVDIIREGETPKGIGRFAYDLFYGSLAIYGGLAAIVSFM